MDRDTLRKEQTLKSVRTRYAVCAMAALLMLSAGGCVFMVGAAAGAVGYHFYEGEAVTHFEKSPEKVSAAAVAAVKKDMGWTVTSCTVTEVKGKTTNNADFKIRVKYVNDRDTEIGVKIGLMGDEGKSQLLISKIRDRL